MSLGIVISCEVYAKQELLCLVIINYSGKVKAHSVGLANFF